VTIVTFKTLKNLRKIGEGRAKRRLFRKAVRRKGAGGRRHGEERDAALLNLGQWRKMEHFFDFLRKSKTCLWTDFRKEKIKKIYFT
jgi:hypothetical protein